MTLPGDVFVKPEDVKVWFRDERYIFRPETAAGRAWLEANVRMKPGPWKSVSIDYRNGVAMIIAMYDAGLTLTDQEEWKTIDGEILN
jgi:hypothetical protein